MNKPVDYDSPRRPGGEIEDESLEELKARSTAAQSPRLELDEAEAAENFELPGADLSGEELTVAVVPMHSLFPGAPPQSARSAARRPRRLPGLLLTRTVRAPAPATRDDHPATPWRGSPPTPDPDTGALSTGPRCRRSALLLPNAGRRYGCTRHDARASSGSRSTSGARLSPADRIAPRASRKPVTIFQKGLRLLMRAGVPSRGEAARRTGRRRGI